MAANLNGYSNRIMVLHQAVSKSEGTVSINIPMAVSRGRGASESGAAFVTPQAKNVMLDGSLVGSSHQVLALPIAEIIKDDTPIDFLKIDVEGLDLLALESTYPLFEKGLVRSTMLEFGPTCRWQKMAELTAGPGETVPNAREHALKVMTTMHDKYQLDVLLFTSCGDGPEKSGPWSGMNVLSTQEHFDCILDSLGPSVVPQGECSGETYLFLRRPASAR
mmetsp:Transcript_14443/g.38050  ORF Transcript_14443/g.38050 Transcript_14443/m.38050 type:complete len:220 (+) Transcript_14443:1106-1765(+)